LDLKENLQAPNGNSSPIVFSDFDGTISLVDVTDEILTQFADPSWREVEEVWVRGEIGSQECLQRQMALVKAAAAEIDALIDAVPIDPGFADFYRFTLRHQLPFYILSDGFDYVISRVLQRAGADGELRNGKHLFSSSLRPAAGGVEISFPHRNLGCPHGCATCKAAIIQRLKGAHRPVVFVGDGLSDRFGVEVADIVFAKRQLLDYCRKRGLAHTPFETFAEVQAGIAKLLADEATNKSVECEA
jgi:2-hydroxy-3-keto-5-methylthiopentenyl-1-phosphate phosphatase